MFDVTDELLYKYVPVAFDQLISEVDAMPNPEESKSFKSRMKRLLRQARVRYLHPRLTRGLGRVAAILICTTLVLALASVGVYAVQKFIYSVRVWESQGFVFERFSAENEGELEPIEPTYIPEGYELTQEIEEFGALYLTYENEDGDFIDISQLDLNYDPTVGTGTEEMETYETVVNGCEATVGISTDDQSKYVKWINENIYYIVIVSKESETELLKIAAGLN